MFCQNATSQCTTGVHLTDFNTLGNNPDGKGQRVKIGHNANTNTDYLLLANFRTSNTVPGTRWLSRYNFVSGNAEAPPVFDATYNVPSIICKMLDLDIYDDQGNAFVSFFSTNSPGTGLRHVSNTGVMTSLPYPPHPNSAYNSLFRANSIACDAANSKVYCAFHVPAQSFPLSFDHRIIIIREYSLDSTNPALVLSTRDYLISETEVVGSEDPNTFYNDPIIEVLNDGNLLLSFAVYSPTFSSPKLLSIFTGEDPNDLDTTLDSTDFSITHQFLNCNGMIRDVEVNRENNDIYMAGSFSAPSTYAARLHYDAVNGITPIPNFAPNFYFPGGGAYATSINFLPNCNRLVVGSSGNMKSIPNTNTNSKAGNLFLMDSNTGIIDESFTNAYKLNTSISTTAQLEDVIMFNGVNSNSTLSNTIFAAGQQTSVQPNLNFVSRFCIGDSPLVSPHFNYCKTVNADGSYSVQILGDGNFSYTLNGNPITDLNNLNGTLVITNSIAQDCSSVISCYQETVSNGTNCTQLANKVLPRKEPQAVNTTKQVTTVTGKSVVVYPNPSDGLYIIRGDFDKNQNVAIDVFDLQAKRIFKKDIANFDSEGEAIDLKDYPSGTYIISIKQGNSKITQTIIKE